MKTIVLSLITVLLLVGCSSMTAGDTPGPAAEKGGAAMSNAEVEKAIQNAPPEAKARIEEERRKAATMAGSGPPPKK